MRAAIITISTSVAAGRAEDRSGAALAELAAQAGVEVIARETVSDDRRQIEDALRRHAAPEEQTSLIFTTGGTGLTPDDVTPEATRAVIDRDAPGFAEAMVDQMMRTAGGSAARVRMVSVGFDLVPALLAHKVDAVAGAYRNYERVQIELQGQAVGMFEPERFGVPTFDELVLITSDQGLARRRDALGRFVRAVDRGIAFTLAHPDQAFADFVRANPKMTLDDDLNRRSFQATLPAYARSQVQRAARWDEFDRWLAAHKVITGPVPTEELYTNLTP